MAQFSLAKPLQPKYNSTTRYLTIFLDAPPVSALVTVAYERLKFDNVFNVRCPKNVNTSKSKAYEYPKTPLTPQLTPKSQKQGEIDTPELSPDLAEIVAVWPELPGHIKAAIKALVQTFIQGDKD